ncbi:hypothetical protein G7Z17_g9363 [Cylindrodendrum hubeiense]|uniref:Uncharacterized protein n=1 Tax=Cylindrodendrum hubeiense TaxID=595255 RepID=A0A9P5H447_9HYPO|nr:hypothetical protein G7Z17_g9363 [Cylindrodendrum hubeiense]
MIVEGVSVELFRNYVKSYVKQTKGNRVWVLHGTIDSMGEEIGNDSWGVPESQVKRVVQHEDNISGHMHEEILKQSELVWYIINSLDGLLFTRGSSIIFSEGLEDALVDVAMAKGHLEREEARNFWQLKKEQGCYIPGPPVHILSYWQYQVQEGHETSSLFKH